jgi:hypothetical protein
MASTAFHAYYFTAEEASLPPVRTELIEATSEDEAASVARSHLGTCKRVDIEHPRWEPQHTLVILAREPPPAENVRRH